MFFRVVSPPPSSTPFAEQFANSTRLLFNISSYVLSLCPLSSISLFHNICLSLNQSLDSYWTIPRHPISIKLCSIPSHQLVSCHSPFFSFSPFSFTAIHSLELYSFLYSFRPWCRFECLSLPFSLSLHALSLSHTQTLSCNTHTRNSGAHVVLTDYPYPYKSDFIMCPMPKYVVNMPVKCNPVSGTSRCTQTLLDGVEKTNKDVKNQ